MSKEIEKDINYVKQIINEEKTTTGIKFSYTLSTKTLERLINYIETKNQENQQLKEYKNLIGKYLNGYKIVKVEKDPFVKGQINLWTDEARIETFGDRTITKFFVRDENNSARIYQELIDKEKYELQQKLNRIMEIIDLNQYSYGYQIKGEIHEILDKVKE